MSSMRRERVLVVEPSRAVAERAVRAIVASGGEAAVATSVAEVAYLKGTFDRGIFAIDLPDGSGVVLAADLWLEDRVRKFTFFDPAEEPAASTDRGPGLRATRGEATAIAGNSRVA